MTNAFTMLRRPGAPLEDQPKPVREAPVRLRAVRPIPVVKNHAGEPSYPKVRNLLFHANRPMSSQEIADRLGITIHPVRRSLRRLRDDELAHVVGLYGKTAMWGYGPGEDSEGQLPRQSSAEPERPATTPDRTAGLELSALAADLMARHPHWSTTWCTHRARVEHMKRVGQCICT